MNKNSLFALWGALFAICAGLGFIHDASGWGRAALTAISLLFFLPPFVLLYRARQTGDKNTVLLIRYFSLLSLGLTLILFIVSILTVMGPQWLGDFLHGVLTVVSTPMMCSGQWALSLFLWACLLISSLRK